MSFLSEPEVLLNSLKMIFYDDNTSSDITIQSLPQTDLVTIDKRGFQTANSPNFSENKLMQIEIPIKSKI